EVDARCERLVATVHREDRLAALEGGAGDDDLAGGGAGGGQRGGGGGGAGRRRGEDHTPLLGEAAHLGGQLVERLLALVVPAAESGTAVTADGVDLVDEDDRGRRVLRLLEQVAHARRADADEHLDEIGAADREERHARFTGDGLRKQRLAR